MTDEELVKRLRNAKVTQDFRHTLEDEAADRIEALTEQLEAARADAKEAEAYAEELEKELNLMKTAGIVEVSIRNPSVMEYVRHWEDRAETAEAKLAKAVASLKTLEDASKFFGSDRQTDYETLKYAHETTRRLCRATLAEIEGEKT